MRVKHFLIPALLSIGACLAVGNLAHAQHGGHGGGGHGGGGHMGGGGMHMGGGHPGNFGGSRVIYGGGYGFGGLGYGYGSFGYGGLGGLGYGYGSGLGYGYGSGLGYGYGNVYSPYYNGAVAPQYSYYASPSTAQSAAGPDAVALPAGAAQIRVILPDPNAKVFFDGAATQQTGTDRYYHTPDLAPGGNYSYRIRATWGTDAQEVVVTVAPGGAATADFRPRSEAVPTPKK